MRFLTTLFFCLAAMLMSGAYAESLSYNYGEFKVGVADATVVSGNVQADETAIVYGVNNSFEIMDHILLKLDYFDAEAEAVNGSKVGLWELGLGLGTYITLVNADFYGSMSVVWAGLSADDGDFSEDDTGLRVTTGVRYSPARIIELEGRYSRSEVFDSTSNRFTLGARVHFWDVFSAGFFYVDYGSNDKGYNSDIRLSF